MEPEASAASIALRMPSMCVSHVRSTSALNRKMVLASSSVIWVYEIFLRWQWAMNCCRIFGLASGTASSKYKESMDGVRRGNPIDVNSC